LSKTKNILFPYAAASIKLTKAFEDLKAPTRPRRIDLRFVYAQLHSVANCDMSNNGLRILPLFSLLVVENEGKKSKPHCRERLGIDFDDTYVITKLHFNSNLKILYLFSTLFESVSFLSV